MHSDKIYQFWEFRVSHGSLLIRSPISPTQDKNFDIKFVGVEYLELPRIFRGIEMTDPTDDEHALAEQRLGKLLPKDRVFILVSEAQRYVVVAVHASVDENEDDIMESPFFP